MGKRNFGRIKSLLHFDYPYFNEPGDGLGDEVGYESWTGGANFKLGGSQQPYAVKQSPYFGYRCAYFSGNSSSNQITGTNNTGIFNLSPLGSYEAECFILLKSSTGGNIFTFGDLKLRFYSSYFYLDCDIWNLHEIYEFSIETGNWYHIVLRNDKGYISVYLDGVEIISATIQNSKDTIRPDSVKLGAYYGAMDEFVFRRPAEKEAPKIPEKPYKGVLDVRKIAGGFGTGADGDVVISADKTINNSYIVTKITSSDEFVVSTTPSALSAGDEVMILLYYGPKAHVGEYVFRNVKSVDTGTKTITLDKEISTANGDDFTLGEISCSSTSYSTSKYYIRCIRIPNYNSLTVNSGKSINATSGIVAFRCKGDCTINGNIISMGKSGHERGDTFQMTHSKLVDRFLTAGGGGIFIMCGGTFTAPDAARIGATWEGNNTGSNSYGAGAGLGGEGSPNVPDKDYAYGGRGGVGGGGGGGIYNYIDSSTIYHASGYHVGNYGHLSETDNADQGVGGGGCGGKGIDSTTYKLVPGGSGGGGQGNSGGAAGISTGTGTSGMTIPDSSNINVAGSKGSINGGGSCCGELVSSNYTNYVNGGAGGGGAGGKGGNGYVQYKASSGWSSYYSNILSIQGGAAGSCLFLVTKKLNIESNKVISTGGQAGALPDLTAPVYNASGNEYTSEGSIFNFGGAGGGGTGFCYIACEEMI